MVSQCLKDSTDAALVILELGCGLRIPTLRKRSEELAARCPKGQVTLVRINPEFPNSPVCFPPTYSLRQGALTALRGIDRYMQDSEPI